MTTQPLARFTRNTPAPALAIELRDALMSARNLGADFYAAGAVDMTRDLYWLLLGVAAVELAEAARFAPVARAEIFDALLDAVDYARSVAPAGAWQNAIATAYGWLLDQECYSFDAARGALRVESATRPGRFYVANGECQCEAHTAGTPCWHRCAARLIARALELRALAEEIAADQGAPIERARRFAAAELGQLLSYAAEVDRGAELSRLAALPPVAERRATLIGKIASARAAVAA